MCGRVHRLDPFQHVTDALRPGRSVHHVEPSNTTSPENICNTSIEAETSTTTIFMSGDLSSAMSIISHHLTTVRRHLTSRITTPCQLRPPTEATSKFQATRSEDPLQLTIPLAHNRCLQSSLQRKARDTYAPKTSKDYKKARQVRNPYLFSL